MSALVSASEEVLRHHGAEHHRTCPRGTVNAQLCPCGRAVILACDGCGEVVFLAVAPGVEPCTHAKEVIGWS